MNELKQKLSLIPFDEISKAVLSNRYSSSYEYRKINLRKISSKSDEIFQAEKFTDKQAFHENINAEELSDWIYENLLNNFKQADFFTNNANYSIKISKKNKVLFSKSKQSSPLSESASHNRQKNYIINEGDDIPVMYDLGIFTKDGKIASAKYDKFKQINRFIELVDDVVSKDKRESYNIIDFGCGKSYLTFILYAYMTNIAKKKVNIVGLDLKKDVIEKCTSMAKKYSYDNLKFYCGDIKDYTSSFKPDMVITLHACDTATDYALYNAYMWGADYIFSVPCCQHEMNSAIKTSSLTLLTDYGLIKERFCALATDAMRAKILEYCGYKTDIIEFIDMDHTPKNILIRAKKSGKVSLVKQKAAISEINNFKLQFDVKNTLFDLVFKEL